MLTLKIETTGQFRTGIAKQSQKPYFMCEAFAHLPGVPYPQKFSYYAAAQNEVLQVGTYECDLMLSIKDDRISLDLDPRQARRLSTGAAAPAPLKQA